MGLHTATVGLTRGPPKSPQSCGRYMVRGSDGLPNCGFRPLPLASSLTRLLVLMPLGPRSLSVNHCPAISWSDDGPKSPADKETQRCGVPVHVFGHGNPSCFHTTDGVISPSRCCSPASITNSVYLTVGGWDPNNSKRTNQYTGRLDAET